MVARRAFHTKAVVLAAGEGTRLRPLTFTRPKPMIPLGPEPSIHYLMSRLALEGFDEFIVVVRGSLKDEIMEYLGDGSEMGLRITYEIEPDGLRIGTAGSLKLGEHLLDETFLVAQADTLTEIPLKKAVEFHIKNEALATIVLTRVEDPTDYGVAVLDEKSAVVEFQEKPKREEARSNLVSTGFYIMEPEAVDYILDNEWDFAKNLFPSILKLRKRLYGFPSDAFWVDIGNLEGYLKGMRWVIDSLTRPPSPSGNVLLNPVMPEGYTLVSPRAQVAGSVVLERDTTIEDDVKVGEYCVVKRNAHISSGTSLRGCMVLERTFIGKNCKITDSVIGQSAVIHDGVRIAESIIGPGCVIGERVDVLKGSRVWPNVQISADLTVEGMVSGESLETAFYCYTNFGQYTGVLATSMEGFIQALERSPVESIEFHAARRDYERWIRGVLGLNEVADGIEDLRRMGLKGEALRKGLIELTKRWADAIESKNQTVMLAQPTNP